MMPEFVVVFSQIDADSTHFRRGEQSGLEIFVGSVEHASDGAAFQSGKLFGDGDGLVLSWEAEVGEILDRVMHLLDGQPMLPVEEVERMHGQIAFEMGLFA